MHFTNVPTSSGYEVYIREAIPTGIHPSSRFDPFIAEAAEKYDVPASLVKAIIKAESDFNPQAVSSAGAQGLMQLMPATGASTARQINLRYAGSGSLTDPQVNIALGTTYLGKMLARFDGNQVLATAAYNAGPGAVREHGGVPPYAETREYVRRVKILYRRYRSES